MIKLIASLLRGRQRLDRIAGRLRKHPEDNVIKFPKKKRQKPKKNMGGLLSLYE